MKIYFDEGKLVSPPKETHVTVDAGNGPIWCFEQLNNAKHSKLPVYTNFVNAIDSNYHWNYKTNCSDLYFKRNGKWVNCQSTTSRNLKKGLNFLKLYVSGEFS